LARRTIIRLSFGTTDIMAIAAGMGIGAGIEMVES
jgi:hypothetical protein